MTGPTPTPQDSSPRSSPTSASGTSGKSQESVRAGLWQLLLQSARYRQVALYLMVVLVAMAGLYLPEQQRAPLAQLERNVFDLQMNWLRDHHPRVLQDDVVIIGIDTQAEQTFHEPLALWHRHYADVLLGLEMARPKAVGVDIVLPERSYNDIVPGLDNALPAAIFKLKAATHLVYVNGVNAEGVPTQVLPIYLRIMDVKRNFGVDQMFKDPDGVARRFSEREIGVTGPAPTLVGQLLRGMNKPVEEGYIDFSVTGRPDYVPMAKVVELARAQDAAGLKALFADRIVLVGTLSAVQDRWVLPVKMARWEGNSEFDRGEPGVLLHMQVLRSHLADGLLKPLPILAVALICLLVAGVVFLRFRAWWAAAVLVLIPLLLAGLSLVAIRQHQLLLPVASITATLWLAFFLRAALDAIDSVVERTRLTRNFSGQVSPAVFEDIMSGMLDPGSEASTMEVCVIFSDIRGFTTLSEAMAPDQVMSVLQRYFDRMVKSVHRFDGTIDKFIGDGMMILFGAPRATPDPCADAVRCALDMLESLDRLNVEFEREGLPKLEIGIGINYGKVVVGNIGSTERHNYSAIGDAVNVAARIEGQTKDLGRRILITESVVDRLGGRFNFEPLGERLVKGHSPVKVWGIRSPRQSRPDEDAASPPADSAVA